MCPGLQASCDSILLHLADDLATWFPNFFAAVFVENHLQVAVLVVVHNGGQILCEGLEVA